MRYRYVDCRYAPALRASSSTRTAFCLLSRAAPARDFTGAKQAGPPRSSASQSLTRFGSTTVSPQRLSNRRAGGTPAFPALLALPRCSVPRFRGVLRETSLPFRRVPQCPNIITQMIHPNMLCYNAITHPLLRRPGPAPRFALLSSSRPDDDWESRRPAPVRTSSTGSAWSR